MYPSKRIEKFEKLVNTKFNIYNSLFLNLPYSKESNIGMFIPMLNNRCKSGLKEGLHPEEILLSFFRQHLNLETEKERLDFMFRVIQYVERQIVLYDSVEDAAFSSLQEGSEDLSVDGFFQLFDNAITREKIAEKLSSFSARIVFTAHPTQFYPPAILEMISSLKSLIAENNIDAINISLQQLGLTSLINSNNPTPLDEAKNIIFYLRDVYYFAVSDLYDSIQDHIGNSDFNNPNLVKLGFWPGGDRDGNPYVTSEITMEVADELRMALMKCYYEDIKNIQKKLTFREVENILQILRNKLYQSIFDPANYMTYEEILRPLLKVQEIVTNSYYNMYHQELKSLIDRVKIFGTHFASLDIRQDHIIHEKVVTAVLKKEGIIIENINELARDELISVLLHQDLNIDPAGFEEDICKDTIRNISQLKTIQHKNGEEGCNRYIISNSENIFSVLFVYALFRWCGWKDEDLTFDIIPLFESMDGMNGSESVMKELFELREYRTHISRRKEKQTIMLGFSDGTKDGSYLKANWSIFKTKEILSEVCEEYKIKAIFFDGRGGPPARGGGKMHRFYAAQSQQTANHEIQLTIQGQTITSKYGTKEHFIHNCEQLLTAGLSKSFLGKNNDIVGKDREILDELANISFEKYKALKEHSMFIPYLENKSTLKYYGQARIGSRPGKRGKKKNLEFADLRAISFVGSWSQLKQNVLGYFGMGTAIQELVKKGMLEDLKRLYAEVPFFKALVHNSMMSLSKSNFDLTAYMRKDLEYKDFWEILHREYLLSKEMLILISDSTILMEEEPISRESIKIRESIVLPLLVIQQYALQKISQNKGFKDFYEKIVIRSLYGNINASRNSV